MAQKAKVLCTVGTRPEAIKMAPVIMALRRQPWAEVCVLATAQHRQMLDQVLDLFQITPDIDLDIMQPNQSLPALTARLLTRIDEVLEAERPDVVLAQGDTTTVMVMALAAYYRRVPFGHIEAGLRTGNLYFPFPEEANRNIADHISAYLFAPTEDSKQNLLREGLSERLIHMTTNTVIDALYYIRDQHPPLPFEKANGHKVIFMTAHRRENFGEPFEEICRAVRELADRRQDVMFVYPVHPNPNVKDVAERVLAGHPRIQLKTPFDYAQSVAAMQACYLILTDSGGIQEEAPALAKPVLVLRNETERPEAVTAGVAKLVGTSHAQITAEVERLLEDPAYYQSMARGVSPYGDGQASDRIVQILARDFA